MTHSTMKAIQKVSLIRRLIEDAASKIPRKFLILKH